MILIVDADPAFLSRAQEVLGPQERLCLASSAPDAVQVMLCIGEDFHLALVDLDSPGVDGFQVIGALRRLDPNLPIVVMSGAFQDAAINKAFEVGATDQLCKPINSDWIEMISRRRRTGGKHRQANRGQH